MSRVQSRRAVLRAGAGCLLAAVAGCLNREAPPGDDPSPSPSTETETSTPEATPTPYPNTTVPFPEGPKRRPERPADLTEDSVRAFVHTHEYRYVYNGLWMGEGTDVSLSCEVDSVTPAGSGYEAVVTCTGSANAGGDARENATGTTTPVHADYFTRTYRYYVDENSILRRSATTETTETTDGG